MSARSRKLRADVLSNKTRSILAALSLAVGTAAAGAMYEAGKTVASSFDASFLAATPPSAMLQTTPLSADLVEEVATHPAVEVAEGRRLLRTRTVGAGDRPVNIELVAMPDFAENRIARIEPQRGSWPPPDGAVVVERASLNELGVAIGDRLGVSLPGGGLVELPVMGSAFDVWEVAPMLGGPARAYISMATMVELTGSDQLDALYLRARADPLDRDEAIATVAAVRDDVLSPAGITIELTAIQDPGEHRGENALSFFVRAMQLLSILALLVAVVLVVNTVAAVLAHQRRQLGVMKAVGATSRQLTTQYLAYVIVLSVAALAIAVPTSILLGRVLAGFLADLGNFDLEPLGIPWTTILLDLVVAAGLPVAAVLVTVHRAAALTVRETIVDRGITTQSRPHHRTLPVSRVTLLAYRNAVRDRPRLVLTVATLALTGAVLVGVLSTQRAMNTLVDQVAGYWNYDIELSFTEPVPLGQAAPIVESDNAVARTEGWFETQAFRIRPDGSENENISVTAAPTESTSLNPTLIEGRWLDASDEHQVVINTHLADEEPDLDVGDDVVLDIEGQRRPWTIVGIATTTLVGPVAFVPVETLTGVIGRSGLTNLLAVIIAPGADVDRTAERLESAIRDAGMPLGEIQTNAQLRASIEQLVTVGTALLLTVGGVLALVAVIGLTGTMTLNVLEQTREIGVIRALGASSSAIRRLLIVQGIAVAAIGAAVGIALSVAVALALRATISSTLLSADLPWAFSWSGVAIWFVIALLIGSLAATRPARVAAKLTVKDTLAYE